MAINSINKDFSNRKKDVNFLAKDFSSYRQRLIDFSKTYFPNTYNDFTEGSVGNMFIELTSYVGDVLSYNIDYNFKEALLTNASEEKNIIRLAQSLGYKVPLSSAAVTTLKVYQLLPDNGGQPDWKYALKVNSGMIVGSSQDSSVTFRTLENIDFSDMENLENVNDYLEIYEESGGNPSTWLVEYFREIPVSSGTVKQTTVNVGAPEQFLTIELPDDDVIDIISVVDSDGNRYYEVDYLAQDSIISQVQINSSTEPFYQPKILKVPRRFVTKVNKDLKKEIQFGSGTTIDLDEETISSIFQADNVTGDTELSIDPSSFSTSKTYGKAPANTTLTIKYSTGGGSLSNVGQGDLTDLREVVYANDESVLANPAEVSTLNQIKTTLTVTNTEQATGGRGRLSPAEIRENALAFFNSQKRCVTAGDYKARILSMPSRFGNVSKAFVRRNQQFSQNETEKPTINAYILSYDNNGRLNTLNEQTKKNISIYLNEFRMLTDGVNLLDGYIVNIGVEFEISVFSSFNKNEVLLKAIEVVKDFFDTDKMDFNQPIYISDLELQIGSVEGVRTVNNVKVVNKTADNGNYSQVYYPIESATRDKIVYPSVEPSVFEVKFPNTDIKGKVK